VDLSDLTPRQADALARQLQPMLGYLTRLTDRMQTRGWKAHDPAYHKARDALHELLVRVRYARCGPGRAGNPSEPAPAPPGERPPRPWEPGGSGRA
jgi:hypothetical protein